MSGPPGLRRSGHGRISGGRAARIRKWGAPGANDGQFSGTVGVATDVNGNVYVTDYGNDRIQKFDANGIFVAKWGSYGTTNGQFSGPTGVAAGAGGSIYVADVNNSRIQRFSYP